MRRRFPILVVFVLFVGEISAAEEMRLPEVGSMGRGVTLLWEGTPDRRWVALTFDDGPIPGKTEPVLDVLARVGVHATFFVLGENAERHPEVLERMVREGHEIGNHTYSHPNLTKLSPTEVRREISRCQSIVQEAVGFRPRFFRPPYGAANLTVMSVLSNQSLTAVFWSVDPQDWKGGSDEEIVSTIASRIGNGAIVLLHERSPNTYESVPKIVRTVREKGFEFVTLSQMFGMPPPGKSVEEEPASSRAVLASSSGPVRTGSPHPTPEPTAVVILAKAERTPYSSVQKTGPREAPARSTRTTVSVPAAPLSGGPTRVELRGTEPSEKAPLPKTLPSSTPSHPAKGAGPSPTSPPPTATPTPTETPTPFPTQRPTASPSPTPTSTFTATPTLTATPTSTPSPTATFTPSATPSPVLPIETPRSYGRYRPVEFRRLHPIKRFSHRFIVDQP